MNVVQMYSGRGSFANQIEPAVTRTHRAVKKGPRITLPPFLKQIPITVDLAVEIWKPVNGFDDSYQVSSKGQVRSLDRISFHGNSLVGKVLIQSISAQKYCRVTL